MTNNLDIFYKDYLNGPKNTEDLLSGTPLDILDNLNPDEKTIAERELINVIDKHVWAINGLVALKSKNALDALYSLLKELPLEHYGKKVKTAYAIYMICGDEKMVDVFLEEIPKQIYYTVLGDTLKKCSVFNDTRIIDILKKYSTHKDISVYLGARKALEEIEKRNAGNTVSNDIRLPITAGKRKRGFLQRLNNLFFNQLKNKN